MNLVVRIAKLSDEQHVFAVRRKGGAHEEVTLETRSSPGILRAEMLAGPMQSVHNGRLAIERYVEMAQECAPFVDAAWVARVLERIRRLMGAWNAVPFGQALELVWPPTQEPRVTPR